MKFFILMIAVFIQLRKPLIRCDLPTQWFDHWLQWAAGLSAFSQGPGWRRYLLLVGLPVLASMLVFAQLENLFWGLAALVVEVLLVAILIRPAASWMALQSYREHLNHGDVQGAFYCARKYVGSECKALDKSSMNSGVIRILTSRWFEHFFLMLFWYLLLGISGMILVWLTSLYCLNTASETVSEVPQDADINPEQMDAKHWLAWIPVRLLGLSYCLIGYFSAGYETWKQHAGNRRISNDELLFLVGERALEQKNGLDPDESDDAVDMDQAARRLSRWQNLQWESALLWMAGLAAASIAGWIL
ncbi:MAG: regulatory signaling modulator protein AmpE [Oceanobacter sp.]